MGIAGELRDGRTERPNHIQQFDTTVTATIVSDSGEKLLDQFDVEALDAAKLQLEPRRLLGHDQHRFAGQFSEETPVLVECHGLVVRDRERGEQERDHSITNAKGRLAEPFVQRGDTNPSVGFLIEHFADSPQGGHNAATIVQARIRFAKTPATVP
jgi:hypothetical protein